MRCLLLSIFFWYGEGRVSDSTMLSLRLDNGTSVELWPYGHDMGAKMQCGHTSLSIVECIRDYLDLDGDIAITKEIDNAKSKYMSWIERTLGGLFSMSSLEVRKRCDLNRNTKIDLDDLRAWNHKCQKYKTDAETMAATTCLCTCESIDSISKYICDRARGL